QRNQQPDRPRCRATRTPSATGTCRNALRRGGRSLRRDPSGIGSMPRSLRAGEPPRRPLEPAALSGERPPLEQARGRCWCRRQRLPARTQTPARHAPCTARRLEAATDLRARSEIHRDRRSEPPHHEGSSPVSGSRGLATAAARRRAWLQHTPQAMGTFPGTHATSGSPSTPESVAASLRSPERPMGREFAATEDRGAWAVPMSAPRRSETTQSAPPVSRPRPRPRRTAGDETACCPASTPSLDGGSSRPLGRVD
ncbi:MAG: hypothetical protein QOE09_3762, partial [Ilumatobacteraceae bacterium]